MNTTTTGQTAVANYADIYKLCCEQGNYEYSVKIIEQVVALGCINEFKALLAN